MKIAPSYGRETVHVLDASRAVPVVQDLMDPEARAALDAANRVDQERMRQEYESRVGTRLLSYAKALERRCRIDWDACEVDVPEFTGSRVLRDFPLADLLPYIDWSPFFHTWEIRGRYPDLLDDPVRGPAARELLANARELLDRIVDAGAAGGPWRLRLLSRQQ